MIRKYKKEENIYIKAILLIVPTIAIMIGLIIFIINVSSILTKYDVVNNKLDTMYKYYNNNDLLSNNNKKDDLLNLIRDFITYRRRHIRFAWIDV